MSSATWYSSYNSVEGTLGEAVGIANVPASLPSFITNFEL